MKRIRLVLGIVFTVVLLIYLFHDIAWGRFFFYLKQGSVGLLIPAALLYLLSFMLRGARWRLFLAHLRPVSVRETTMLMIVGYAVNNVFPVRLGEFVRAYLAGKRNSVSRTSVLASVFVERVFDGLTIVLVLVVVLAAYPFPDQVKLPATMVSGLFVLLFLFLLYGSFSAKPKRFVAWLVERLPRIFRLPLSLTAKFLDGAASLDSPVRIVFGLLLSMLIWGFEVGVYMLVAEAFSLTVPVVAYFYMLCAVNLGMLVAPTPAGLGVFQAAVLSALQVFSVVYEKAMAVGVVLHGIQIIPVTIIGMLWLYLHHISFTSIEEEARNE